MVSGGRDRGSGVVFGGPRAPGGAFSAQFGPGETELIFWRFFASFFEVGGKISFSLADLLFNVGAVVVTLSYCLLLPFMGSSS